MSRSGTSRAGLLALAAGVALVGTVVAGCSLAQGAMHGSPSEMLQGANEAGQTAASLAKDLAKCDTLGQTEVTIDEERTLGGTVALNWVQQNGGLMLDVPTGDAAALGAPASLAVAETPKNQMTRYLNVVGRTLGARSTRPTLQWTFGVLDSPAVNAISAPGGYVFVTRGLLARIANEAALAGVLSHEIAHVSRKDAFAIYTKTKVDQCKTVAYASAGQGVARDALARTYGGSFVGSAISAFRNFSGGRLDLNQAANSALLTLFSDEFVHRYLEGGYAREQELGADAMGLELATATGYAPRGFVDFVAALPSDPAFFAHHPPPADRATAMRALMTPKRSGVVPFSPFTQDLSRLPLLPLGDELAAAR